MQTRALMLGLMVVAACGGDEDPPGQPKIRLMPAGPAMESGAGFALVAKRVGDSRGQLDVEVATTDETAVSGADYSLGSNTLRWADGETGDKMIVISTLDDLMIEGDETFSVLVRDVTGSIEGAQVSLTIQDDDRVGEVLAVTTNQRLISFDRGSASVLRHSTPINGLLGGESIVDVDFRPRDGKLYALTDRGMLYTVDPINGAATSLRALVADPNDATDPFTQLNGGTFGLDFNPVVDRLRVVSSAGQNLRIDVDTGRTITDASLRGAATGMGAAGYLNNIAEACRTRLYGIDILTDQLVIQDPPNDGVTTGVGAGLGVSATSALLDIETSATGATTALALLTVGSATELHSIDLATGAATRAGELRLAGSEVVRGMAIRLPALNGPVPQAAGELFAITEANRLISFNRAAPAKACTSAPVTGLAAQDEIVGFDVRPSTGLFYALTSNAGTGALYTIDSATGAASGRVALSQALVGTSFGVDFNPTGPVALRIVSDAGQNLRVTDIATGATTVDGALNGPSVGASGAAYINSVQGAGTTTLYTIDPVVDRLRIQNPPNNGTQVDVGGLGHDVAAIDGFDIDGRDNLAFAAFTLAGATTSTFHTVDLTTGAMSASLGSLGTRLRGMARPSPITTVFGLLEPNQLVTFSLANPAAPTPVGNISGLAPGEELLGIDFRPSTGLLYGLGSLGGVYEINVSTAAASRISTLSADPTDTTSPFSVLSGVDFGLDFNPTGPVALRVISDAEQNLRIPNPLNGMAITDLDLTAPAHLPTPDAKAAAYTNSFPGSLTTTLYVIDTASNQLMIQNPPNNGVLVPVGPLSTTRSFGRSTFDIAGGGNGLALAAMQTYGSNEAFSRLYRIDLATGAVTEVGSGIGTTAAMRGMAIRVR